MSTQPPAVPSVITTATLPPPDRLTIHHFKSGTLYAVSEVMSLFGRSDQWVRNRIATKQLDARKLGGSGPWLVSGESVRVLYGSLQFAEDVSGPPEREEREEVVIRRELEIMAKRNRATKVAR